MLLYEEKLQEHVTYKEYDIHLAQFNLFKAAMQLEDDPYWDFVIQGYKNDLQDLENEKEINSCRRTIQQYQDLIKTNEHLLQDLLVHVTASKYKI